VIEEKSAFYAFDEIEAFRTELKKSKLSPGESQHRNYGALLFRLVNHFKCQNILQIYAQTGIMSLYIAAASKDCVCYAIEESTEKISHTKKFAEKKGLHNLRFISGTVSNSIDKLQESVKHFDLVFVNCNGSAAQTNEAINLCKRFLAENTVLVVDGISLNKGMRNIWNTVKNMPQTVVSLDLYAMGIVLFNKKLNSHHYKIYFDYGKKQNLHPNRRRGFYFTRRREKNN
jgi:predicted O-methyltransferase YrrM